MVVFSILNKNKINHSDQILVNSGCGIPEMFLVKKSCIDNVEFVGLFSRYKSHVFDFHTSGILLINFSLNIVCIYLLALISND